MEVFARLENISFHIKQLKSKCALLEKENEQLKLSNKNLEDELLEKRRAIDNLEETNKITKLAQGSKSTEDKAEFINHIDQLVKEIDKCLILVKQ